MWGIASILLLLLAIALIVQIPAVQLKIAKYATTWITDKTHGRVELKDFRIQFPKTIVIRSLYLEDLAKDTLVSIGLVKVDIAFSGLLHQKVQIHSLDLEDAVIKINRAEKDSLFNYNYLITAFSSESPTPKKPSAPWTINLKKVRLNNMRVTFDDYHQATHMAYSQIMLVATDMHYSAAKTGVTVKQFTAIDQNGFAIKEFRTVLQMDPHQLSAKKTKIQTLHSYFEGDLSLGFDSLSNLTKNLSKALVHIRVKKLLIHNTDVLYFMPKLDSIPFFKNKMMSTSFSGEINGPVNRLTGKGINIGTGSSTRLKANFTIIGLPDYQTALYDFPIIRIHSGRKDLELLGNLSETMEFPEVIDLEVTVKGKLNALRIPAASSGESSIPARKKVNGQTPPQAVMNLRPEFKASGKITSSFGNGRFTGSLDEKEDFTAVVGLDKFNIGRLMKKTDLMGTMTLQAKASGHGLDIKTIRSKIEVTAPEFNLKKYTYHNLTLQGVIAGMGFDGSIKLNDENADFDFKGKIDMNGKQAFAKFRFDLKGADLKKLNLMTTDTRMAFSIVADFRGEVPRSLNGQAAIKDILVMHEGVKYPLDSIFLKTTNKLGSSSIKVASKLIDLTYDGSLFPTEIAGEVLSFVNPYFSIPGQGTMKTSGGTGNFTFIIQLHNHPLLSNVFFPLLKEFRPGVIQGSFDGAKKELKVTADMEKITYGEMTVNGLALEVHSDARAISYSLSCKEFYNTSMKMNKIVLDGELANQRILANLSAFKGNQEKLLVHTNIRMNQQNYQLRIDPPTINLMGDAWSVAPDNYVEFGKQGFLIHHFYLENAGKQIWITSANDRFNDDLSLKVNRFKLDDISRIMEQDTSFVKGVLNGNILLKRTGNTYGIIADAQLDNLVVKNIPIGNVTLKASNSSNGRFDVDAALSGKANHLTAKGFYAPNAGAQTINLNADIQSLSLETVKAFSLGALKEASGNLSGHFNVGGNLAKPEVTGELTFDNALINPAFLNSRLGLKHERILLEKDGIHFNHFTMLDVKNHPATIDGSILMTQFSNPVLSLRIDTKDFLLFNTGPKDNAQFYGKMLIDSRIDIHGPISLPVVNARIKLKKGSNMTFAMPEETFSTNKGEDVVEFVDTIKEKSILFRTTKKETPKSSLKGFDVSSIIEIDEQASIKLLIDPTSSDSLVVKGQAALSFSLDRSGKMSLTGTYLLKQGDYLLSLESLVKRRFKIESGSTIIWYGDPMSANISINAIYTVNALPIDLISSQSSTTTTNTDKQRYPFLVYLKLRGDIQKPDISFEIKLRPEDRGIMDGVVQAKLNMLNENPSELNKQVFALLVLGRFIQENPFQSEATGLASAARTTMGTLLSSQLNQWSSKLVPGIEMNFDIQSYEEYQSGKAAGRSQLNLGVKKQLFNERLSVQVGGKLDMEGERAKQNSVSDIASDVVVEYKLTKNGQYRLKGFRQSLFEGAIEGQLVETGVGLIFVRDFNSWHKK